MSRCYCDIWDVTEKSIDPQAALGFVSKNCNGAETLFVGTVRDYNQGKSVLGVSYDVFEPLAINSFKKITQKAKQQWGDQLDVYIVHAKGRLPVGGISIVIAVGSPHRDEAFKANRYIIDAIKHQSPIWKLEHYVNGNSEWTQGCELCEHKEKELQPC